MICIERLFVIGMTEQCMLHVDKVKRTWTEHSKGTTASS